MIDYNAVKVSMCTNEELVEFLDQRAKEHNMIFHPKTQRYTYEDTLEYCVPFKPSVFVQMFRKVLNNKNLNEFAQRFFEPIHVSELEL